MQGLQGLQGLQGAAPRGRIPPARHYCYTDKVQVLFSLSLSHARPETPFGYGTRINIGSAAVLEKPI